MSTMDSQRQQALGLALLALLILLFVLLRRGAHGERRMSLPLLVVVLGPTASGKTSLSLHLAERLQGEIVSCDSVAVYREFEIGTAKPSRKTANAFHII